MKKTIDKTSSNKKLINRNNEILLSEKDKKVFLTALINPPKPNKALLQAAKLYKKHSA
jgi:uncharacterized protein (DUF1778 family)